MAVIGLLGITVATLFVIKAGGAATTADPDSPPPTRTVTATCLLYTSPSPRDKS